MLRNHPPCLGLSFLPCAPVMALRLRLQIHQIFKKIGTQSESMAGLDQLYTLWEEYPYIPVDRLIAQTPTAFQIYIQQGLEKVRSSASRR